MLSHRNTVNNSIEIGVLAPWNPKPLSGKHKKNMWLVVNYMPESNCAKAHPINCLWIQQKDTNFAVVELNAVGYFKPKKKRRRETDANKMKEWMKKERKYSVLFLVRCIAGHIVHERIDCLSKLNFLEKGWLSSYVHSHFYTERIVLLGLRRFFLSFVIGALLRYFSVFFFLGVFVCVRELLSSLAIPQCEISSHGKN